MVCSFATNAKTLVKLLASHSTTSELLHRDPLTPARSPTGNPQAECWEVLKNSKNSFQESGNAGLTLATAHDLFSISYLGCKMGDQIETGL